jgi:C4-dicarboxylate-specific signal transduction histidine kinase
VSTTTDEPQYVVVVSAVDIGELVLGVDGHVFLSLLPSLRVHHVRRCNARVQSDLRGGQRLRRRCLPSWRSEEGTERCMRPDATATGRHCARWRDYHCV